MTVSTISTRTISRSMLAVLFAFCAALTVPALSGAPTGEQATVAVNQQAEWRHAPRQQRILIARNNRTQTPTVMAQTEGNAAM
jgi:hypothetical protein